MVLSPFLHCSLLSPAAARAGNGNVWIWLNHEKLSHKFIYSELWNGKSVLLSSLHCHDSDLPHCYSFISDPSRPRLGGARTKRTASTNEIGETLQKVLACIEGTNPASAALRFSTLSYLLGGGPNLVWHISNSWPEEIHFFMKESGHFQNKKEGSFRGKKRSQTVAHWYWSAPFPCARFHLI